MLRLLTALLAGLFVAGLGLAVFTDTTGIAWIWPTVLPLLILGATLAMIGRTMRGVAPVLSPAASAAPLDRGLGALARITGIKRTGTSVNDAPLCELGLIVAPDDGDAYATTIRMIVDPVDFPRYQPGGIVTVARLEPGGSSVALVREPDARWRRRMAEETHRVPATAPRAEAEEPPGRKPIIGVGARGRGPRVAAYLALFAVGVGIVAGPNHEGVTHAVEEARVGDDYDDFVNGDRQAAAVAALTEVIGDTKVVVVTFHADSEDSDGIVTSDAPSAPGATTIDSYLFQFNEATRTEHPPTQPRRPEDLLFDIGDVDLSIIAGLAARTRDLTGIADPGTETVRIARETPGGQTGAAGPPLIDVSVGDRYHDGSVTFTVNGEVHRMSGGAPGSKAAATD